MSIEKNKELVIRLTEDFWNARDITAVDQFYSPDLVTHSPNDPQDGNIDSLKEFATEAFEAFPDLHIAIDDLVAEGAKAVKHWTCRGTHKGEFMRIPATGKKLVFTEMEIFRFENEKVMETWEIMDLLGMLQQLGVIPPLGEG